MEEKIYTQKDMDHARDHFGVEAENMLLKQILEQKLEITLIPKLNYGNDSF